LCFWTADSGGVSLWLDVRAGGTPIVLGQRRLDVCEVLCVEGEPGESAYAVQRRLCAAMSPSPRMPDHPVYGVNDWHFAYGNNSFDVISRHSDFISQASPNAANRPYSVIDDGWSQGGLGHGPWLGNDRFGPMDAMARHLVDLGVRPGIWYRPLTPLPEHGDRWRISRGGGALDPTVPEVAAGIADHLRRLVDWGYTMIKHDFTTWDIFGRWGSSMGAYVTDDGWSFADRSKTSAEVVLDLYRLIREACGDTLVIGCNTFSHLSAGLFELQRTGDDTSGQSWNRTRRMGVNTLAFRASQHATLYAVDADIAPITPALPWRYALQWLHLVSASGTAAFVSVSPECRDATVASALRDAFTLASQPLPVAEPLDWMHSTTPSRWRLGDKEVTYDWNEPGGGWPFTD
jgi:alpha-galactosidase